MIGDAGWFARTDMAAPDPGDANLAAACGVSKAFSRGMGMPPGRAMEFTPGVTGPGGSEPPSDERGRALPETGFFPQIPRFEA